MKKTISGGNQIEKRNIIYSVNLYYNTAIFGKQPFGYTLFSYFFPIFQTF